MNNSHKTIEQRIQLLEDVEAIKRLKYQYNELCDAGFDGNGIGALFAPNGRWVVPGAAELEGPEAIATFFNQQAGNIPWCLHYGIAPIVDVAEDGLTATGRFYLFMLATISNPPQGEPDGASVYVGTYEDSFVKIGTEWKFQEIKGINHRNANWAQGWVAQGWRK